MRRWSVPAFAAAVMCGAASAAAQPTVAPGTFHNCGLTGTAKTARAQALDTLKNRATVPSAADIHPAITAAWMIDDSGRFQTTDAATIRVFVTLVKDGSTETVNCGKTKAPLIDVHIEANADGPTYTGQPMILEITPRWIAAMKTAGVDWSRQTLKAQLEQHWVEVTGWLLADDEHLGNAENTVATVKHKAGTTPNIWRRTVWEIHPVSSITIR